MLRSKVFEFWERNTKDNAYRITCIISLKNCKVFLMISDLSYLLVSIFYGVLPAFQARMLFLQPPIFLECHQGHFEVLTSSTRNYQKSAKNYIDVHCSRLDFLYDSEQLQHEENKAMMHGVFLQKNNVYASADVLMFGIALWTAVSLGLSIT